MAQGQELNIFCMAIRSFRHTIYSAGRNSWADCSDVTCADGMLCSTACANATWVWASCEGKLNVGANMAVVRPIFSSVKNKTKKRHPSLSPCTRQPTDPHAVHILVEAFSPRSCLCVLISSKVSVFVASIWSVALLPKWGNIRVTTQCSWMLETNTRDPKAFHRLSLSALRACGWGVEGALYPYIFLVSLWASFQCP